MRDATDDASPASADDPSVGITVSQQNSGLSFAGRQLEIRVNGNVAASSERVITSNRFATAGWPFTTASNALTVQLTGADAIPDDDTLFTVIDRSPPTDIPLITATPGGATALYLGAAYAAGADFRLVPTAADAFDTRELRRSGWVVVDDPAALPAEVVTALRAFLEAGGQALVSRR